MQLINCAPDERWAVFLGNNFKEAHTDQWVAEVKGEELAELHGVNAWLMLDGDHYQHLDWGRALETSLRARTLR